MIYQNYEIITATVSILTYAKSFMIRNAFYFRLFLSFSPESELLAAIIRCLSYLPFCFCRHHSNVRCKSVYRSFHKLPRPEMVPIIPGGLP